MKSPYREYDVLREVDHWDAPTQAVIRRRLEQIPPIRFFSIDEALLLERLAARIMPQDERPEEQRIAIVPWIDEMLAEDDTSGFREPDLPWHQELWRQGLAGVQESGQLLYGQRMLELDDQRCDALLAQLQQGQLPGETWRHLPPKKFFKELVQQIAAVYYAHPAAWSEIGWAGPASPRGYVRTGYGMRDPWEPAEQAPASSVAIIKRRSQERQSSSGEGEATH